MKETIKELYYKLNTDEFKNVLNKYKNSEITETFFVREDKTFFFVCDKDINNLLMKIHKQQNMLDLQFNALSSFQQRFVKELLFIDEIKFNNDIESINSTRHDIFGVLKKVGNIKDKYAKSALNIWDMIENPNLKISSNQDIRYVYDVMMNEAYESSEDKPDGEIFRKNAVYISNGIKAVHKGYFSEEKIIRTMNQFIEVYNKKEYDIYERMILSHFLLETIHPFYDGNGRFGRLLMAMGLYKEEKSVAAYTISKSVQKNKKKYYKAFSAAEDAHEYGCLNGYFEIMGNIILDGLQQSIELLVEKKKQLIDLLDKPYPVELTKLEKQIYKVIAKASVYSYAGISNKELIELTGISKRTVSSTMVKFRKNDLITDAQIGKEVYHKLKGVNEFDD